VSCQFNIEAYPYTGDPNVVVTSVTADIPGVGTATLCSANPQVIGIPPLPGGGWVADGVTPFRTDLSGPDGCTGSGPITVHAGDGSATGGVIPVRLLAHTLDETPPNPIPVPPPTSWPAGPDLGPTRAQAIMAGDDTQVGPIADLVLPSPGSFNNGGSVDGTVQLTLDPLVNGGACGFLACGPSLVNGGPTVVLRGVGTDVHTLNGGVACPPANDDLAGNVASGCQVAAPIGGSLVGTSDSTSLATAYGNRIWAPSGTCSPNNWPSPVLNGGTDLIPAIPRGDPRLITVAVTTMGGSFGPGDPHPIVAFAAFYVTGGADAVGCGDGPPPATALLPGGNEIWGHFLKFVEPSSSGGPTDVPCVPPTDSEDISACIATLVQ